MHMDGHACRSLVVRRLPAVVAAISCLGAIASAQAPTEKGRLGLTLAQITTPWTGDLDGMVERRMVRVLTAYNKTQYFIDRGTPRGTAYDQGRLLEEELNRTLGKPGTSIHVQFVPLSRNELLPALIAGKGDIVMADLTVTPERQEVVDFTEPWIAGVEEIVVTRPGGPVISTVEDLSGQGGLRPRIQQLLPEPDRAECAAAKRRQAARDDHAGAGGTRGRGHEMDWMLMAAQGYQESRLDHGARSHVGAIGVMQVMPATGTQLKVGDIRKLEPNIHAGVKYIRSLVDRYYANEPMDELNKVLFAFAAYNAGPGRVRQLRREAEERGLDRNIWFNNVERIASERIGRETVTYVSNIYKYYVHIPPHSR